MAHITYLPDNRARLAIDRHRLDVPRLDERWAMFADAAMVRFAGWLFPDGLPGWLGDHWAEWVALWRSEAEGVPDPATVDWATLWAGYVDAFAAYQPEWRERVGLALGEPSLRRARG